MCVCVCVCVFSAVDQVLLFFFSLEMPSRTSARVCSNIAFSSAVGSLGRQGFNFIWFFGVLSNIMDFGCSTCLCFVECKCSNPVHDVFQAVLTCSGSTC